MAAGNLSSGEYAASVAQAANALSEPLIPNNKSRLTSSLSSSDSFDGSVDEEMRPSGSRVLGKDIVSTLAVALLATGGLAASVTAMIAIPGAIVFLMGGICILNSPIVALKHLRIVKNSDVRTSVNNIRNEGDLLKREIDFLAHSVEDLQTQTSVLIDLEQDLQDIAVKHDTNVSSIIDLVNENELILNEMKRNLRQMFVQSMIVVIMRSDKDGDMKIDAREACMHSLRLQIQLEPYDMKLDTDKFEAMIREDSDISNVLRFCGELLCEEDRDDDSVDSEVTVDFELFCRSLDDKKPRPMSFNEKVGMISVNERFSKGSVEVARGSRMILVACKSKKDLRRRSVVKKVKKRQSILAAGPQE